MSVSPLTREMLDRLGFGEWKHKADDYGRREQKTERREKKLKKARDFTNNIKIDSEIFEIQTIKGKKTVIMPWDQLAAIQNSIPSEIIYKGLKGAIVFNHVYTVLAGEKLELILSLAPALDMDNALSRDWPRKQNFFAATDLASLLEHMDSLVKPALWKKNSKEIGFLSLFTDGEGNYWLRCSRGYYTSLNESLASLEALIEELDDDIDLGMKHIVNTTYRRLSEQVFK